MKIATDNHQTDSGKKVSTTERLFHLVNVIGKRGKNMPPESLYRCVITFKIVPDNCTLSIYERIILYWICLYVQYKASALKWVRRIRIHLSWSKKPAVSTLPTVGRLLFDVWTVEGQLSWSGCLTSGAPSTASHLYPPAVPAASRAACLLPRLPTVY